MRMATNNSEENMDRRCGCKGIRSCLLCEKAKGIQKTNKFIVQEQAQKCTFVYCPSCGSFFTKSWNMEGTEDQNCYCSAIASLTTPMINHHKLNIKTVFVQDDFLSPEEENVLMKAIQNLPWTESQSGRRKQDFGPKVNFKKKKLKVDCFQGFPDFVGFLVERLQTVQCLKNFRPIELCHLEYDPKRGSAIDPHLDDSWLWGPRLVTISLGSPTVLTLTHPTEATVARVPLKGRSLLVLDDQARYMWKHAILREDISAVRLALTFRELSPEFLPGGAQQEMGHQLLERAQRVITHA